MPGSNSKPGNGLPVFWSRVTHILFPTIFRKLSSQLLHQGIPVGFGQDRGGGNREKTIIPFDHTVMGDEVKGLKTITINQ